MAYRPFILMLIILSCRNLTQVNSNDNNNYNHTEKSMLNSHCSLNRFRFMYYDPQVVKTSRPFFFLLHEVFGDVSLQTFSIQYSWFTLNVHLSYLCPSLYITA